MIERLRIYWIKSFKEINVVEYDKVLSHYSEYYNDLNPTLKKKFIERTFIANNFIKYTPNNFDKVTEEMKIIICSALTQITFGLNQYILSKFTQIYVVPSIYNFGEYKNLLGHVDFNEKCMVISWPSVQEGFIIPDDAVNVALHEMAHAIQGDDRFRRIGKKFFNVYKLRKWEEEGVKKLALIRQNKNEFLKNYGGLNMLELFAVSIEAFFEQSEMFKVKLPALYNCLVDLLNQDPTNKSNPIN